jgi:uncharacterized Ntn-hydrolase superfamily protein
MGLEYFIDPEIRKIFGPVLKGIADFARFSPIGKENVTKNLYTSVANLLKGQSGVGPVVTNIGRFASAGVMPFAEVFPPTKISGKIGTKAASKIVTPKEAKILDEFAEGPKTIQDSVDTLKKLGQDTTPRVGRGKVKQGFKNKWLEYLADKFGVTKTKKELGTRGWRQFMGYDTGLPIKKRSQGEKIGIRYHKHKLTPEGLALRKQATVNRVVDDFTALKNKMESDALTLGEAVGGRKATKHYRAIKRFEKYADDIKNTDDKLYNFFTEEIANYKLGKITGKKSKVNPILDIRRTKLAATKAAKSSGIKVGDLQRAHTTMNERIVKLHDLIAEGKITKAEYQNLRKPQYLLLNLENQTHKRLENTLDTLLNRRVRLKEQKNWDALNATSKKIDDLTKEMTDMRVESVLWDPIKEKLRTFGLRPSDLDIVKTKRGLELAEQIPRKYNQGGIASISHLTRPI